MVMLSYVWCNDDNDTIDVCVCVKGLGNILVELFRFYESMGLYSKTNMKATVFVFPFVLWYHV